MTETINGLHSCKPGVRDRFNDKWTPEPFSGCWLWTACDRSSQGYGGIKFNGKMLFAHRVSWELHFGAIPSGTFVCHRCDTPACVNPEHLFLGSNSDNMEDCRKKGRINSKLTGDQVLAIRSDARTTRCIAREYGISHTQVNNIQLRKKWRSI